jgi:hypothetical protein
MKNVSLKSTMAHANDVFPQRWLRQKDLPVLVPMGTAIELLQLCRIITIPACTA